MFSQLYVILFTIGLMAAGSLLILVGISVTVWSVCILMECFLILTILFHEKYKGISLLVQDGDQK